MNKKVTKKGTKVVKKKVGHWAEPTTIKYRGETLFAERCPICKKSSAVLGYGGGGKRWHNGKIQTYRSLPLSCGHNKSGWHNCK